MRARFPVVFLGGLMAVCLAGAQAPPPDTQPVPAPSVSVDEVLARVEQELEAGRLAQDAQLARQIVEALQTILTRDEANTRAHLLLGEVLLMANDYDGARDQFRLVLNVEPSSFRANMGIGRIYIANRQYRQAVAYLEKARSVAIRPEEQRDVKRYLSIGYAYSNALPSAIEMIESVLSEHQGDLDFLQTAVEVRLAGVRRNPAEHLRPALGVAELFLQEAGRAVEQHPADLKQLEHLDRAYGLMLEVLREYHNSFYERDLRNQPTDRLLRGSGPEAAAALDRIARVMSDHALLKLTLTEHNALVPAQKAVEYEPGNVHYLENLAALYQRIKDRPNAVATCRRILEIDPAHDGARRFLEMVGEPVTTQPAAPAAGAQSGS